MKRFRISFRATLAAISLIGASAAFGQGDLTPPGAPAFEGRVEATLERGGDIQTWRYTIGADCIRVERGETNRPYAQNLVARDTGAITLLFPHNRSFVRLKGAAGIATTPWPTMPDVPPMPAMPPPPSMPRMPAMPRMAADGGMMPGMPAMPPPGMDPQASRPSVASLSHLAVSTNPPGMPPRPDMPQMPAMPAMPQMPAMPHMSAGGGMMPTMPMMPMPGEDVGLTATGETTNLLGYACARFEIKQRGEVMEIWATDDLLPFQPWLSNQQPRGAPRMLEEQWGGLMRDKKLFPLLAVLSYDNGPERMRFTVTAIQPQPIADPDGTLFQPPPNYHEIRPLPF